MNPKNKKTIGILIPVDCDITGKDLKEALKTMMDLFKKAMPIDSFSNLLSERELKASDILEKVI